METQSVGSTYQNKGTKKNRRSISSFKTSERISKSPKKQNIGRCSSIVSIDPTLIETQLPIKQTGRKDAYGTMICKGSKKHKVSFIDQINQVDFADYLEVNYINVNNEIIPHLLFTTNTNNSKIIGCKRSEVDLMKEGKESTQCTACILF